MKRVLFLSLLFFTLTGISAQMDERGINQKWKTDKKNAEVPLSEFRVLLKRDGIPPIDNPGFWDRPVASDVFFEHEPVIVVTHQGQARGYPLSVLTYHEIVNDSIGDFYFSVTFCPLCNASIVFNRRLVYEGTSYLLDFGVSGMLRKSDLVMWDRQTESWWQQLLGRGLVGTLAGAELEMIPSQVISLGEFYDHYPDGLVLSTETGHNRAYGTNPYERYDMLSNKQPRLFGGKVDDRLPAMERVVNIYGRGKPKIYPLTLIREKKVINDRHEGRGVVLFYRSGTVSVLDTREIREAKAIGSVTVYHPVIDGRELTFEYRDETFRDAETGSVWTIAGLCVEGEFEGKQLRPVLHGNHFAFAWLAFHPETAIYE